MPIDAIMFLAVIISIAFADDAAITPYAISGDSLFRRHYRRRLLSRRRALLSADSHYAAFVFMMFCFH